MANGEEMSRSNVKLSGSCC